MAALLRAAARRLGGSIVQRAAAEGRRQLGPRLVHTKEHVKEETASRLEAHEQELLREIQQKKEELYNAIAKAEQSFLTSSSRNKRLLEHLAVQVNPRPEDSKWRRLCFIRRANTVLDTADKKEMREREKRRQDLASSRTSLHAR